MNSSGLNMTDSSQKKPKLGIIGGSGMCSFPELKILSKFRPETKYGFPSDDISICEYGGELVAFLPRHGSRHTLAPHKIPYRANLEALKEAGVEYVIGTCIVGSLKKSIHPGSLVLLDQFVNLTWGRDDSSQADGGSFIHLPMAEPYCEHLRQKVLEVASQTGTVIFPNGTVAVIQGPRFSTIAESRWLSSNGWDVVNMTQYPECYFARELRLCYTAVAAVTDYDVGLQESLTMSSEHMSAVLGIFKEDIQKTKLLLMSFIENSVVTLSCKCASTVVRTYYESSF